MNHSENVLIFNITLYLVTFLIYQIKKKQFDIGSFTLFFYFIISIISFELYNSPFSNFKPIKLFPFIFLYVSLLLMFNPILKFKKRNVRGMPIYNSKILKRLAIIIFLVTFSAFIIQVTVIPVSSLFNYEVLLQNYIEQHEELENFEGGVNYFDIFQFVLNEFTIPLLIYFLLRKEKLIVWGLVLCIVFTIIISLTKGARSGLASMLMSVPFVYFVFQEKFTKTFKRRLLMGIVIISSIIFIGFAAITIARFDENRKDNILVYTLQSYSGQSFLNFNNYGLNANGIRYGDRVMPLLRKCLGMKTSTNFYERRDTYRNMTIDDSYFITFVGDFTLDFGPIIGFIILTLFSLIFGRIIKLRGNYYYFSQIFMLYMLYKWVIYGFTLWPYAEKVGNLKVVLAFLIYFLLRREEKRTYLQNSFL